MAMTKDQKRRIPDIDYVLRPDESELKDALLDHTRQSFIAPYARVLSTFTLLLGEDDIVFGASVLVGTGVRMTIVTPTEVLRADIPDLTDSSTAPEVATIPRASIRSLSVASDMRFDLEGSRAITWPGHLSITAVYDGVGEVLFDGSAYDFHAEGNIGPTWRLLDGLRSDLQAATAS